MKYFDETRNFLKRLFYDVCFKLFTRRKQNQHKKGVNVIKKNQPYSIFLSGSALKKVLAWCCCDEIHREFRRLRLIEGTDIVYPLFVFASIRDKHYGYEYNITDNKNSKGWNAKQQL